jgi:hypothetical protein
MGLTLGAASQPSQLTMNFDSIMATSLANARKTISDNISNSNAFFYEAKKRGLFESADGGAYIQEDLMYELASTDSYDSYDTLGVVGPEGITAAFYEWRQTATPIAYSEKERKQNKHRIAEFVQARIKQGELGAIDFFCKSLLQGNGAGDLTTAKTSATNGSLACDPLFRMIQTDPSSSTAALKMVGNIDQSSYSWWRNRTADFSSITTSKGFLDTADHLFNDCSKGPGRKPNLILCDQTTFELWNSAYYSVYRRTADSDNDYPFPNIKFRGALVVWDENFPNLYASTLDTTTTNGGGMVMLNFEFLKVRYESETDFVKTEFVRPANQDAKVAHILWMGNITCNNRRKQGLGWKIPRTLT